MSRNIDVLVTGAGPVGLTTALFLEKHGLHSAVIDAKASGVTHSYALALHPASLDILDQIGAAEEIVAKSLKISRIGVYSGGRRLTELPVARPDAKYPFVAVIGQDVLETTLARLLGDRGVAVRWNMRLARFDQHPDDVAVDIDELEQRVIGYAAARIDWLVKSTHVLDVPYLVGADGHQSLVRRQLQVDFPEVAPAENFAVFEFKAAKPLPDEIALVLHDDGLAVLWPLPGGRGRWSFSVSETQSGDMVREKDHEPVQIIGPGVYPSLEESFFRQLLGERAPWFNAPIQHIYWRILVRFERRLASTFGKDRIWLAGDAGHLTGPAGIQSMNVGIREGRDLAGFLQNAIRGEGAADGLARYARERLDEWNRLLGMSGKVEVDASAPSEVASFKDALLGCLPASGSDLEFMGAGLGLKQVGG